MSELTSKPKLHNQKNILILGIIGIVTLIALPIVAQVAAPRELKPTVIFGFEPKENNQNAAKSENEAFEKNNNTNSSSQSLQADSTNQIVQLSECGLNFKINKNYQVQDKTQEAPQDQRPTKRILFFPNDLPSGTGFTFLNQISCVEQNKNQILNDELNSNRDGDFEVKSLNISKTEFCKEIGLVSTCDKINKYQANQKSKKGNTISSKFYYFEAQDFVYLLTSVDQQMNLQTELTQPQTNNLSTNSFQELTLHFLAAETDSTAGTYKYVFTDKPRNPSTGKIEGRVFTYTYAKNSQPSKALTDYISSPNYTENAVNFEVKVKPAQASDFITPGGMEKNPIKIDYIITELR